MNSHILDSVKDIAFDNNLEFYKSNSFNSLYLKHPDLDVDSFWIEDFSNHNGDNQFIHYRIHRESIKSLNKKYFSKVFKDYKDFSKVEFNFISKILTRFINITDPTLNLDIEQSLNNFDVINNCYNYQASGKTSLSEFFLLDEFEYSKTLNDEHHELTRSIRLSFKLNRKLFEKSSRVFSIIFYHYKSQFKMSYYMRTGDLGDQDLFAKGIVLDTNTYYRKYSNILLEPIVVNTLKKQGFYDNFDLDSIEDFFIVEDMICI